MKSLAELLKVAERSFQSITNHVHYKIFKIYVVELVPDSPTSTNHQQLNCFYGFVDKDSTTEPLPPRNDISHLGKLQSVDGHKVLENIIGNFTL